MKRIVLSLLLVFLVISQLSAEVPRLINYQGILTDDGGTPLDGTYTLTFSIYPDSTLGTTAYWSEEHLNVNVDEGLFNVLLGGVTVIPDSLFNGEERWMGITVDPDPEMRPLMRITAVPWALRAAIADTVLSGGGTGDGHSLDAADGDPTDALYVNDAGYVGIGTTSPMGQLDVRFDRDSAVSLAISNQSTGSNSKESLRFRDENGSSAHITAYDVNDSSWPGRLVVDNGRSGGSIWFRTNSTDRLSILNNGNIGIGVTSATEKFQVAGTIHSTTGGFRFPDGTVQTTADVGDEGLALPYYDSTSVNYSAFSINNGGVGAAIKGRNGAIGTEGFLGHSQYGVLGYGSSGAFAGVRGVNENGNYGHLGTGNQGVYGEHFNGHYGRLGTSDYGAYARNAGGNWGYIGGPILAMYGKHATGAYGYLGGSYYAVAGYSDTVAVHGYNMATGNYGRLGTPGHAVYGRHAAGNTGILGGASQGAYGANANGNYGHLGHSDYGAYGQNSNGNFGRLGTSTEGVRGEATVASGYGGCFVARSDSGIGVYGEAPASGYGGYFAGSVRAEGIIHSTTGGFRFPDGTVQVTADTGEEGFVIPHADTTSHEGPALYIQNDGSTSSAIAVAGTSNNGYGVYGDGNVGIRGDASGGTGVEGYGGSMGVYGYNTTSGTRGHIGGLDEGVSGKHGAGTTGKLGTVDSGVRGSSLGSNVGVLGINGTPGIDGNEGMLGGADYGVRGEHANGHSGYLGTSSYGAYGEHTNGNTGYLGGHDFGVKSSGDLVVEGAYKGNIGPNNGAPFPRPAYDSGWTNIDQDQTITLIHNIGGNVSNYFIDMIFKTSEGNIHNVGIGGYAVFFDAGEQTIEYGGCVWSSLTTSIVRVTRQKRDSDISQFRLRIWVYN